MVLSFQHGIPISATQLIGRERELAALQELLARADVRLLTLTGPPGVGKTRLALELAALAAPQYPQGATFVDLAPLADSRLVLPRTLNALGIREGGGDVLTQLLRALRKKSLLLFMDNFEHVLDAAVPTAEIVAHCPQVKVVVTSRTPLRLRGEHQVHVPALATPDLKAPPLPDELLAIPAVALFVERARAVDPGFRLATPFEALAVAGICARLDGLPLAIEIVAAHTQHLSAREIWQRLSGPWDQDAVRLLNGPIADLPPRHRTLFTAIAWSYKLLPPALQSLFRRLGVFAGGFGLDAVQAVCLGDDLQVTAQDGLNALLDHNLLDREPSGNHPRYRMLQTVREFALSQLHAGEEARDIYRRHANHYLELAEQAEPHLWGREQITWLERIELDGDNLRAVLEWSLSPTGDRAVAERLGGALARFWDLAGYWDEGLRWLDRLLAVVTGPSKQSIRILVVRSYNSYVRGDYAEALRFLDTARLQAQGLSDPWGLVFSHIGIGAVCLAQGDASGGLAMLEEGARLARSLEVKGAVSAALTFATMNWILHGDYPQADRTSEEALASAQAEGNHHQLHYAFFTRGLVLLLTTRFMRSFVTFQESLGSAMAMKERMSIGTALEGLGWAAIALGQGEFGTKILAAASALREHLGGVESHLPTWRIYHDAALVQARMLLGGAAFDSAWAAGVALPLDEAIALALTSPAELSQHSSATIGRGGDLSSREIQVVGEIAQGLTNGQIAIHFGVSRRTVDFHVRNILSKLNFSTRSQIAAWAVERGLRKPTS